MVTTLVLSIWSLAAIAALGILYHSRTISLRSENHFVAACRAEHQRAQIAAELETTRARAVQHFIDLCQAEQRAEQLAAALEEKRKTASKPVKRRPQIHTPQTINMFEDLASILLDGKTELGIWRKRVNGFLAHLQATREAQYFEELYTYLAARLDAAARVLQAGRAGPYAYQPVTTADRPPRPGTSCKTWTL